MAKEDHDREEKTDSSMSIGGQKMCSDGECVGQIIAEDEGKKEAGGRKDNQAEAGSSMRAGKHQCVDDQCIGKS